MRHTTVTCWVLTLAAVLWPRASAVAAELDGTVSTKPERMRQDFHNLFVVLLLVLLCAWIVRVALQLFRAGEVSWRLTRSRSLQLEAMSIYAQDFMILIRQHFNQILRIRRTVPPKLVSRCEVFAHVHPESIRCLWVGEEESGGGPMGFGVEFDIDASVPCCVQLYWGLSATACNDLAHRGQLDFLTAPRGSRPATNGGGFSNSLRQLRGRWTGGRSYANPETTRSLLEMEELNLTACQAEPCAEPQSEDRIFSTRDFVAQSRDFFLPAGCGQRYVTPAGDLIHPDRMAEFDFLASWLRAGQAEPGATIPLAIVVLASGRVSGPVQGRAILETKGEISTVRFHKTGPTQGQSNFPFHTAEIFRQLCLGEQMLLEVQGIFGFEEAGDTDCMICYARPKNVLLLPCRHCSVCHSCLRSLRDEKCPLCRSSFGGYLTGAMPRAAGTPARPAEELPLTEEGVV